MQRIGQRSEARSGPGGAQADFLPRRRRCDRTGLGGSACHPHRERLWVRPEASRREAPSECRNLSCEHDDRRAIGTGEARDGAENGQVAPRGERPRGAFA